MRRALLCSLSVPWPHRPLLGSYHLSQARALTRLGLTTDIASPAPFIPDWAAPLHSRLLNHWKRPQRYEMSGVTIHSPRVPFAFPKTWRFDVVPRCPWLTGALAATALQPALVRLLDQLGTDVLLGHGILPWGELLTRPSVRLDRRLVFIEHSWEDVMRLRSSTRLGRAYCSWARQADAVVTVSRPLAAHLRDELGLENASWIPNGADLPSRSVNGEPRPAELTDVPLLLAAGSCYRRKGFPELLAAFARLSEHFPTARLVIVTDRHEALQARVDELDLGSRVQLLPLLSPEELRRWMSWSDVFVMPSWDEAFGLVAVEALAEGTPVIVTEDCGVASSLSLVDPEASPDPTESSHGWRVPSRDVDSLSDALTAALSDPQRARRFGAAGCDVVRTTFSWTKNAEALLSRLTPVGRAA
ncbi:MAG: glycosyltransferase family 4 protein [Acidobacteriota bacterium]